MKRANFHAANTVLMFEGGGMRASYTAAMASLLLEQNINLWSRVRYFCWFKPYRELSFRRYLAHPCQLY